MGHRLPKLKAFKRVKHESFGEENGFSRFQFMRSVGEIIDTIEMLFPKLLNDHSLMEEYHYL